MDARIIEFEGVADSPALGSRVLAGEVFVLRGCMQALDLFEAMRAASLEGIRRSVGEKISEQVARDGFEAMHHIVDAADVPAITEAVYELVAQAAPEWLDAILHEALGTSKPFFFERQPNVRFLIPYDSATGHDSAYQRFAKSHGEGKITPHGPHRDSWLDCPSNSVNVWIAVGPVSEGNGMSLFPEVYGRELPHTKKGEITREVNPGKPLNFTLAPGDALVFHGDQVHASELNRTDETRHVVSFRLTFDRPHFRDLHYHHYAYSGFGRGPLRALSGLPANLSWKYVSTRLRFLGRKLAGAERDTRETRPPGMDATENAAEIEIDLSEIPVGTLHPVSERVCATRLDDGRVFAFARSCPHQGADLVQGHLRDGSIICPWHNLRFDLATGQSPCSSLRGLRRYPVVEDGDRVRIALSGGELSKRAIS